MEAKSITRRHAARSSGPLQFVNTNGQRLDVEGLARQEAAIAEAQAPRRGGVAAKKTSKPAAASRGFEIVGIRVRKLQKAAARAGERRARWEARPEGSKAREPEAWDEVAWLDKQPLQRAMRETFAVESAAQLAAEMLKRQGGWVRVAVRCTLA